jgi:hydrogenase nickel incorporation protein HypA/HybF
MHELSIALSILDVAEEEAERHGNAQVHAIHLRLGPLSGVLKEALLSAYELAREGSPLASAELKIEETPLLGRCPACGTTKAVVSMQDVCCTDCGTPIPDLESGGELQIVALEISPVEVS